VGGVSNKWTSNLVILRQMVPPKREGGGSGAERATQPPFLSMPEKREKDDYRDWDAK